VVYNDGKFVSHYTCSACSILHDAHDEDLFSRLIWCSAPAGISIFSLANEKNGLPNQGSSSFLE
jgi:hypothetical protein